MHAKLARGSLSSRLPFAVAPLLALALGCHDPGQGPVDAPQQEPVDAPQPKPVDAPQPVGCPAGMLCLKANPVVPGAAIPDGRLVVVFYQFIDDIELPLQIKVDVPFSGSATEVQLALADIAPPAPIDDYRLCIRSCLDLSDPACDCPAAEAKATTAYIFVVSDLDSSGAIEPSEITESNFYGIGYTHLAGADAAYPTPNPLDIIFVEGITEGLAPYRIIQGDPFDKLGIPAPGTVFELDLCVPGDASCSLVRFPNLT